MCISQQSHRIIWNINNQMLVATQYLLLQKDPAATRHLIKKLAYFKTKDQIFWLSSPSDPSGE